MYEAGCLTRLKAINILQRLDWPLADIRKALSKTDDSHLVAILKWVIEAHRRERERKAEERMKKIDLLLGQLAEIQGTEGQRKAPSGAPAVVPSWTELSKLLGRLVESHEGKAD